MPATSIVRLATFVTFATLVAPQVARAQAPAGKSPEKATLADVAFIAGTGTGTLRGGAIEEQWAAPAGDSMMGMFRYTKDGRAVFYEFMLIEQTATGPVLRLKHFNPGLIGWEEKAEVFSYPLVELQPRRAVFERPDKQTRLTFDGTSGRQLIVTLDQMKNGKQESSSFTYDHLPPASPSSSR
jgi:Domain of unknown function (DUF6265)